MTDTMTPLDELIYEEAAALGIDAADVPIGHIRATATAYLMPFEPRTLDAGDRVRAAIREAIKSLDGIEAVAGNFR